MNDELIREIMIGQKPLKNTNELLLKKEIIRRNKEIEELKAEIKELNDDNVWWTNRFNAIKKEHIDTITRNEEYRARIDKALEFIEKHNIIGTNKEYLPTGIEKCYSLELMEILKGE